MQANALPMNVPAVLRAILVSATWKQKSLADALGVSQATVSRWIAGKQRPDYAQGLKIEGLATLYKVTISRAPPKNFRAIVIVGLVGLGETITWVESGDNALELGEIDLPFPVPEDCVALEARGDSMAPRIRNGEMVIVRHTLALPETMIGQEVVVRLDDGTYLYKTIRRGYEPNRFNLESFNAPLRENVKVEWLAEVWAIVPTRRWKHVAK